MHSFWGIDTVDSDKSMVRLRNAKTNLGKAYFFPRLKQAELQGTKLVAYCEDGAWELDILTGVRKKLSSHRPSELKTFSSDFSEHPGTQEIPYFLQKK